METEPKVNENNEKDQELIRVLDEQLENIRKSSPAIVAYEAILATFTEEEKNRGSRNFDYIRDSIAGHPDIKYFLRMKDLRGR